MARERGFIVVGGYEDAVESGKDDDRPGFQALLRDMRAPGRVWDTILALDTARIARRRALAIIFEEQECKRAGVRVVYRSLPESDPVTEMLLKSILQAMDEWHSLTSKAKGLAGMAENVRQGWRAGGRAPRGYRLQHEATGAVRDGSPVTKSRLVPADDAMQLRAYLSARARGLPRRRAMELVGVALPPNSAIEIERNALTYAGHTTWNRHAERDGSTYTGGKKWRPRAEWIIQRSTHDALISDAEAESILAQIEAKQRRGGGAARRCYLLAGIMTAPDGRSWIGDAGSYRLGKGVRVAAEATERAVVSAVVKALQAPDMARAIAAHYRDLARRANAERDECAALRRRVVEIDRQTSRLAELAADTRTPAALLRQIEALEDERERIAATIEREERERASARRLRDIDASDVRRMLRGIADDMNAAAPQDLKDALRESLDGIELSPETWEARIRFRLATPAAESGDVVASPRGFEPRLSP
ncbi:MAG: recombinase family protein [Azoarcus sp.]|nr:recombinase family protein [Azoarcus sp.]